MTIHGDVVSHVNISRVRIEDGGQYACAVANRAGVIRHAARLNVYGKTATNADAGGYWINGKSNSLQIMACYGWLRCIHGTSQVWGLSGAAPIRM